MSKSASTIKAAPFVYKIQNKKHVTRLVRGLESRVTPTANYQANLFLGSLNRRVEAERKALGL